MGGILNGMAFHGGVFPFGGTFFVFSDYMRPAIRLAALSASAGDLRVHPRQHRSGRGRPHSPAHRASGLAAGDARPGGHQAERRDRDRRGLAGRARAARRAHRAGADPAEPAGARPDDLAAAADAAQGRLRAPRRARRTPGRHPYRRPVRRWRSRSTAAERSPSTGCGGAGRGPAQLGAVRELRTPTTGRRCCRAAVKARVADRGGGAPSAGSATWAQRGKVIGLDHFGASAPAGVLYQEFGITAEKWSRLRSVCSDGGDGRTARRRSGRRSP